MLKRILTTASAVAVVALALSACSPDDDSPATAPASVPPAAASTTAAPGADPSYVTRGATGERDVDVQVAVAWRGGAPDPEARSVRVKRGDRIKVLVRSDSAQDIAVSGHPDAAADVDPKEPEDVDFTMNGSSVTVSIEGKARHADHLTMRPGVRPRCRRAVRG